MTSRTRLWVLAVSTPIIAFAIIGGYLGQALAKDGTYQHLRVFQDVVQLVLNNYVEPVDIQKAMRGAMNGLSDSLDADSGYLPPDMVRAYESTAQGPAGDVGLVLTRQYYLRVVSVRDGSSAARAGIRTGDFVRAIDTRATRDMTVFEGSRLLRGAPGSKVTLLVIRGNAAEPHTLELVRERITPPAIASRMLESGIGYIRLAHFSRQTATELKQAVDAQTRGGATRFIIDVRGSATGDLDDGIAPARLFVKAGTLTVRENRPEARTPVDTQAGDGAIAAPVVLLVDQGTSGAAEVFAAALDGNQRAELVGEHTLGRAARQRLVKLPDGSGLLLSNVRYLTPGGQPIHERGLTPDVEVEQPEIDFGTVPPATDATLQRAIDVLTRRQAA
jgi:carboxyl-terminal processing protease